MTQPTVLQHRMTMVSH